VSAWQSAPAPERVLDEPVSSAGVPAAVVGVGVVEVGGVFVRVGDGRVVVRVAVGAVDGWVVNVVVVAVVVPMHVVV
jgi:hypothetical protein